jgi:hypothetical protein
VFEIEQEQACSTIKSKIDGAKNWVTTMLSRNDAPGATRQMKDVTDILTSKAGEEKSNPKIAALFTETRTWVAQTQPVLPAPHICRFITALII